MADELVGPDGKPATTGPKGLVVFKCYNTQALPHPQMVKSIGQALNSHVIVLPGETELMLGRIALEEVKRLHECIHRLLKIMHEETLKGG